MLQKWSALVALAASLVAVAPVWSQPSYLVVSASDTTASVVQAPLLLTRAILVENTSPVKHEVLENVLLPQGWQLVGRDSLFFLPEHGRDLRLVCVSIPARTQPDHYRIEYTLSDAEAPGVRASSVIEVVVAPVFKVDVTAQTAPRRILAGEPYSVLFTVANLSNVECTIDLEFAGGGGIPPTLTDKSFTVRAGESRSITLDVKTDRTLTQSVMQMFILSATVHGQPATRTSSTITVEIVPQNLSAVDMYHRVPSRLATRFLSQGSYHALQVEIGGSGTLDNRGTYKVNYLLRGPSDSQKNIFGFRDEYYVGVQHKTSEARVGDLQFGVSPLLEQNRFGRGAKVTSQIGPVAAGLYSFKALRDYSGMVQTAGFAGFSPEKRVNLRLGILRKATNEYDQNMVSVGTVVLPARNQKVELEYGSGFGSGSGGLSSTAYHGRADGNYRAMHLTLEKIWAGKDFNGYYHDMDQTAATAYAPVWNKVRGSLSYRNYAQNLATDPARLSAQRERDLMAGLTYDWLTAGGAELDLEELYRRDALNPLLYNWRERAATLRARHTLGIVGVNGSVRRGFLDDYSSHSSGGLERYSVGLELTPDSRQSYCTSYQTGQLGLGVGARRSNTLSFDVNLNLIHRVSLHAGYQKGDIGLHQPYQNDQFTADLRTNPVGNHILVFRMRQLSRRQQYASGGTSYLLGYEVPLGMPVGREGSVGAIRGRIYDAEDSTRAGISGVVVTLDGMTTLTDRKGQYAFPGVTPGIHYLQVDQASIGIHRVTTRKVPIEIRLRGGRTETIDIGVIRAATLRGDVAVFGLDDKQSASGIIMGQDSASTNAPAQPLKRLYGLNDLELELRSDQEVVRVVTNCYGMFSLDDLRPGKWSLVVPPSAVPEFHDLERSVIEVSIDPAQCQDVVVKVLPRVRPLIIMDEGTIPVVTTPQKKPIINANRK